MDTVVRAIYSVVESTVEYINPGRAHGRKEVDSDNIEGRENDNDEIMIDGDER